VHNVAARAAAGRISIPDRRHVPELWSVLWGKFVAAASEYYRLGLRACSTTVAKVLQKCQFRAGLRTGIIPARSAA